ncbi:MAG: putative metal-binding motif-containing protein [Deltaproteobacteria bacterium]|nr:putative metal-binding motif-containing protein [Deltaproteobacteria bacterium]
MKNKRARAWRRYSLAVGLLSLAQCRAVEQQSTGVLLTVSVVDLPNPTQLTRVDITARNVGGDRALVSIPVEGRDISKDREPIQIFIQMAAITKDDFFLHARGFVGNDQRVAGSVLTKIVINEVTSAEIGMSASFQDADGDGFPPCGVGALCDCNDQNASVNPFTPEICADMVDSNCNGQFSDGCPCSPNGATRQCTSLTGEFESRAGIGRCNFGVETCSNGVWAACGGDGAPQQETRAADNTIKNDGVDDDCNGVVDAGAPCTAGAKRACLMGFVNDAAVPTAIPSPTSTARGFVYGTTEPPVSTPFVPCVAGVQTCGSNNKWGESCDGEVRPQRIVDRAHDLVGFMELPSGLEPTAYSVPSPGCAAVGQCDGLDNDCDGGFDEEPWFDADYVLPNPNDPSVHTPTPDGYTYCGTNVDTRGGTIAITDPKSKVGGLAEQFIDCADDKPNVNPGETELCTADNRVDEDCRCDHDRSNRPYGAAGSEINRPFNKLFNYATCSWPAPATNCVASDSYLDCQKSPRYVEPTASGSCASLSPPYLAGYYDSASVADQTCGSCYECGKSYGLVCSAGADRCASPDEDCRSCAGILGAVAAGGVRPSCRVPDLSANVCTAQIPVAGHWTAVVDADPCDDCPPLDCDGQGASPQTPVYWGSDNPSAPNPRCFYAADVVGECDGAGSCKGRVQECGASSRGIEVPSRPLCRMPDVTKCVRGRVAVAGEPYTVLVPRGQDPYDDCAGAGTCDGAGNCHKQIGDPCGTGLCENTAATLTCADGVCCTAACGGTCFSCLGAKTGGTDGTCAPISNHTDPDNECASCKECNGAGVCANVADNTQDNEGTNVCNGTCQKCAAGTCQSQASTEDLFGQCGTTGCFTGNCRGGAAACGYYNTGKRNCSVCASCDGATSGSCVPAASGSQDIGCSGTCQKCNASGSCVNQASTEDLFGQCPDSSGCYTGNCQGGAAQCGLINSGEGYCPSCWTCTGATSGSCVLIGNRDTQGSNLCNGVCEKCNGSGVCVPQDSIEDLFSQCDPALGCLTGNCRGGTAECDYYTSGERNCPACRTCDASGVCASSGLNRDTTNPNRCDGLCQKCDAGSCATQASSEDLFTQCPDNTGCYTGTCRGTTAECGYVISGEGNCPVCGTCVGATSGSCVSTGGRDTAGASVCNGTCQKCTAIGTCDFQTSGEDLFGQCGTAGCSTGNCRGGAAECGYYTSLERNCAVCTTCDLATSGTCVAMSSGSQDTQGTATCSATNYACSGAGPSCLGATGAVCGVNGDCEANNCVGPGAGKICCPAGEYKCGTGCVASCGTCAASPYLCAATAACVSGCSGCSGATVGCLGSSTCVADCSSSSCSGTGTWCRNDNTCVSAGNTGQCQSQCSSTYQFCDKTPANAHDVCCANTANCSDAACAP